MKKFLSSILLVLMILGNITFPSISAVNTNGLSTPWTREKATHLAKSVLLYADSGTINQLVQAGSAEAAINLLFPDAIGPDRTAFNNFLTNYTASGFNWGNAGNAYRYYQLTYALDPYEAKRKLFSLFEDIFSVNNDGTNITYQDVSNLHSLLYANMLGNYQVLVKKVIYNNGGTGDYAAGAFLNLFNQTDAKNPNENYARELLQLFLMGEYEPFKSKDNNDVRNYEESDVRSLARILTGLKSDSMTHAVSFDINSHYSGSSLPFLSGALTGMAQPYYNSASGTIDPAIILSPIGGNNGLTDNIVEYIFAKRSQQIALFLADRLYRFYIHDTPTRAELDTIANNIVSNNFEMLPVVKTLLASDPMYSEKSMNSIRYKNPLELAIGTIKLLQGNTFAGMVNDQNIYDTSLLSRLGWTPYFPGSIFGRDGFDNSIKWTSTSNVNTWMSATNYFVYRNGTGSIDFRTLLGSYNKLLTTETIPAFTSNKNIFSGSLSIIGGAIDTGIGGQEVVELITESGGTSSGEEISLGNTLLGESSSGTEMPSGSTAGSGSDMEDSSGGTLINLPDTDSGTLLSSSGGVNFDTPPLPEVISSPEIGNTTGSTITTPPTTESGMTEEMIVGIPEGETTIPETLPSASEEPTIITIETGEKEAPMMQIASEVVENIAVTALSNINSGAASFPNFTINTNIGAITVGSGVYQSSSKTLLIFSGSITSSGSTSPISSGSIIFSPGSSLTTDVIDADTIISTYSTYLYGDVTLPSDVRTTLKQFLETDESGALLPIAPSSTEYYNKKIRGLISIMLSQPEYMLLRGSDIPTKTDTNEQHFLDSITGKLIFIELYGGNDYLTSLIPKDEYSTYVDYRSNGSGTIALSGSDLVDIGNFYMNANLAYGSGGAPSFKSLYDEGSLKFFNRVGGYRHSQDHDAAAKQISSYNNSTDTYAEGLFGHLVSNEFESSHTISLGARRPNVYRSGRYVNMGGSVILTNPVTSTYKEHMNLLESLIQARSYPSNTRANFSDAGRISDIAKVSVAAGGPSGANGDMNNIFRFTKILMENNIGRAFYMGGYGGYDTHDNQFSGLNRNLQFVSSAVTNFFNSVKNTQDVTIIIFSEFGRTSKTNGGLGTDHGDGGGMYVITSNNNLKSLLQNGTYGNMSIKYAKANSLGIGVDYRSVYGKLFQGLYNLDAKTYFQDQSVDLDSDVSLAQNEISLLSYRYQASGQNIIMNAELSVTGSNYNPGKAGYTRILGGTGANALKNVSISQGVSPQGYRYTFQISSNNQPFYQIDSFSNQYALTSVAGTLTGSSIPMILGNTVRTISQTGSSILTAFGSSSAPSVLSGSGIILEGTGGKTLSLANNPNFGITFDSGSTRVTTLTSASGSLVWNGGFILGEEINRDTFIPKNAIITNDNATLQKVQVARLVKIGADRLGVGMTLNQNITLTFKNIPDNASYRVLSSEDGVRWTDVEMGGKTYQRDVSGNISFPTNHFSYFALVGATALPSLPSCSLTINPSSATNNTPVQLSWNILNTSTGTLNPGNSTITSATGSINIIPPPSAITTYTLQVSNVSGNSSCTASVLMLTGSTNPGGGTGSGRTNTGSTNTGSTNTGSTNTGSTNPGGGTGSGNTNTGSTNTGSTNPGGGTGSGGTNTGSTNTGSTNPGGGGSNTGSTTTQPIAISGPGGGGGGSSSSIIQTISNIVQARNNSQVIGANTDIDTLLNSFFTGLQSDGNTSNFTSTDRQKALRTGIELWKIISKDETQKGAQLEYTLSSIEKKLGESEDDRTIEGISQILGMLQNFENRNNPEIPQNTEQLSINTTQPDYSVVPNIGTRYVAAERYLTLRSNMKIAKNSVISYLARNEAVQVVETIGNWSKVLYHGIEGYVKSSYLRDEQLSDGIRRGDIPASEGQQGTVQVTQSAFIRNDTNVEARIVGVAKNQDSVIILDEVHGWLEILWNGIHGYMRKWLIQP